MINGMINVYKEAGFTSHDVVAKLRGILKQKKIGHTGTLDPDAVGVLPVCLGNGTRLCDMLADKSKEYVAVMHLGVVTDTQDMSGSVLRQTEVFCGEEELRQTILSFVGSYAQIPPMYSALKVNGKKLYELARQGKEIERAPRPVTIQEIEILSAAMPLVKIRVVCSKGTYIRTLCHDIGEKLGCGAAMETLVRTRVGQFTLKEAVTLSEIETMVHEGDIMQKIIPVDSVFRTLPKVVVKKEFRKRIDNGNSLYFGQIEIKEGKLEKTDKEQCRVYNDDDIFCGIYGYHEGENQLKPVKMFSSNG